MQPVNYHGNRDTISSLIDNGFWQKFTYSYDGFDFIKVGINGDYTVKSSDDLYTNMAMQEIIAVHRKKSLGKKTLIFNNGINIYCIETFEKPVMPFVI
jgi:hypothetical protein